MPARDARRDEVPEADALEQAQEPGAGPVPAGAAPEARGPRPEGEATEADALEQEAGWLDAGEAAAGPAAADVPEADALDQARPAGPDPEMDDEPAPGAAYDGASGGADEAGPDGS